MPYSRTTWVDNSAPDISAANLNNIETGVVAAPYGPDASANKVPVGQGSSTWLYQLLTNAQIDPAAAISLSKLGQSAATLGQAIQWSGSAWVPADAPYVYARPAAVTVSNTTTPTDVVSQSIAGNTLGTTKKLRVQLLADWLNNSGGAVDTTVKIAFGGTTVWQGTIAGLAASANARSFFLSFDIGNIASAASQFMSGFLTLSSQTAPTTGIGNPDSGEASHSSIGSNGTLSIDTTAAKTLAVTVTLGTAASTIQFRMRHATIEVV